MKRIGLIVITALLSFWLSACGGSSSNSSSNTNPSTGGSSPAAGTQNPGTGSGGTNGGSSTTALAYVAGSNQNFFGIRVDSSSNISTVSGSPYSLSGNLLGLAATGNLLFASSVSSDFSTGSITSYSADGNGALTQVATTPVGSSGGARIALDSTGKFLYGTAQASNNGGTIPAIFGFSVDQNSGKLTSLAGSPWRITQASDASSASNPAVTANGSWLCLDMSLARTNEAAQCYARHADGTIDPNNFVQPAVSNTGITGLALTADSSHLLYSEGASNQVFSTQISSTQNGNPVSSQGRLPEGIAVDSSGRWIAVVNHNSNNVAIFSVGAGDMLAAAGTAGTAANPAQVAFSHSGNYLFVTTTGGTVVYQFNSTTGAAKPLNASNPAPGVDGAVATM